MTNQIDTAFFALSDPTRRAVIERLAQGPATVSDLAAPHDIALPTFLRHLKVLEQSGLVKSSKAGRVRTCHIEATPLSDIQTWIDQQQTSWDRRLDRISMMAEDIKRSTT